MNTVGKILVVLNLLFAVGFCGIVVVYRFNREEWRELAESRKQISIVYAASANAAHQQAKNLREQNKKLSAQFEQFMINSKSGEGDLAKQVEDLRKQVRDQAEIAKLEILNREKAVEEGKRLQKEVALLAKVVKQREEEILVAQTEVTKYRQEALTKEDIAKSAVQRAQNLLKQLQEKELQLVKQLIGGTGTAGTTAVGKANYENPPPAYVKGRIEKIDAKDRNLVQVSIGSDAGVKEDHTLEVYRLRPRPEYLGRLRIVEARHQTAVGRLMRSPTGGQAPLQEGDEVASKIR